MAAARGLTPCLPQLILSARIDARAGARGFHRRAGQRGGSRLHRCLSRTWPAPAAALHGPPASGKLASAGVHLGGTGGCAGRRGRIARRRSCPRRPGRAGGRECRASGRAAAIFALFEARRRATSHRARAAFGLARAASRFGFTLMGAALVWAMWRRMTRYSPWLAAKPPTGQLAMILEPVIAHILQHRRTLARWRSAISSPAPTPPPWPVKSLVNLPLIRRLAGRKRARTRAMTDSPICSRV